MSFERRGEIMHRQIYHRLWQIVAALHHILPPHAPNLDDNSNDARGNFPSLVLFNMHTVTSFEAYAADNLICFPLTTI